MEEIFEIVSAWARTWNYRPFFLQVPFAILLEFHLLKTRILVQVPSTYERQVFQSFSSLILSAGLTPVLEACPGWARGLRNAESITLRWFQRTRLHGWRLTTAQLWKIRWGYLEGFAQLIERAEFLLSYRYIRYIWLGKSSEEMSERSLSSSFFAVVCLSNNYLKKRTRAAMTLPALNDIRTPSSRLQLLLNDHNVRMSAQVKEVQTKPYDGQKPGTSGLRKRWACHMLFDVHFFVT